MNHKKEKTCPDAATSRQVKEIDFDKPVPQLNYTTESQKDNPAFLISDLLHYGRQNAVSRRTLARISGLSERDVRKKIHEERANGTPIISNNIDGYWLSDDEQEIRMFARSMFHRADEIVKTARAAEHTVAKITDQQVMEGW